MWSSSSFTACDYLCTLSWRLSSHHHRLKPTALLINGASAPARPWMKIISARVTFILTATLLCGKNAVNLRLLENNDPVQMKALTSALIANDSDDLGGVLCFWSSRLGPHERMLSGALWLAPRSPFWFGSRSRSQRAANLLFPPLWHPH